MGKLMIKKIRKKARNFKWAKKRKNKKNLARFISFSSQKDKKQTMEARDIFILRFMREKFSKKILFSSIDWMKQKKILNFSFLVEGKEVLFRFHLTDGKSVFREMKNSSNAFEVHIEVGNLDSFEKRVAFQNLFKKKIEQDTKGISNENFMLNEAQKFADTKDFTLLTSKELDNKGVDFVLKSNWTLEEFYFQVKSSWYHVSKAKEKNMDFYQGKEIIFLVKNLKDKNYFSIIDAEINKQKNR